MANFNTGVGANLHGTPHTTAFTFAVPAGVLTGDLMVVSLATFAFTSSSPAVSTPTSGGGSWTQIGTLQDSGPNSGLNIYGTFWYRVASASDPGSTFSVNWTGVVGSTDQFFWCSALDAWTGFDSSNPIGSSAFRVSGGVASTVANPSVTTGRGGSWGLQSCVAAVSGSGTMNATPTTQRTLKNAGDGLCAGAADTNASAGAAGSSIGGGSFTLSAQSWYVLATIELATSPLSPPASSALLVSCFP